MVSFFCVVASVLGEIQSMDFYFFFISLDERTAFDTK